MKIAYIMETLAICGGLERIMTAKMNHLADNALCDVVLIEVYDYPGSDAFPLSERVKRIRLGIKKHSLTIIKPMTFWKVTHRVNDAIIDEKPDVMISAGLLGVYLYGLRRYNCRMIYESHQPRFTMPLPWLVRRMEENVDAVVCLTEGDAKEYRHARRVAVIPNFIEQTTTGTLEADSEKRSIAALGRLDKQKGFDLLIRAWQQIQQHLPGYTLNIYGEGRERETLQALVCSLGLEERVCLHPATSNPSADVYQQADIVCVTSEYEGFSLVIVEAMAHGVPAVACDVPHGPRHLIKDGKGGILVERTEKAIGSAMLSLLKNRSQYSRLASEGPDIAAQYSRERIMQMQEEFLKSI